jgi:hypothetical protein
MWQHQKHPRAVPLLNDGKLSSCLSPKQPGKQASRLLPTAEQPASSTDSAIHRQDPDPMPVTNSIWFSTATTIPKRKLYR